MLSAFPSLPGTDRLPCIVQDTREQLPLVFSRLPSIVGTLATADYSIVGMEAGFAVERKSIPDLLGCCCSDNRARFERELARLQGYRFRRLLIVGTREEVEAGLYRSQIAPSAVLGSLACWEIRYDVPVVWAPDPAAAAAQVETWAWYAAREAVKTASALLKGCTLATPAP